MNAMSHKAPHTRPHMRACLPSPPPHSPRHPAWHGTQLQANNQITPTMHTGRRQHRAHTSSMLGAAEQRAGPQFKARANVSQPHLPGLNGPQSESRNKTKGRLQPLASALPHTSVPPAIPSTSWPREGWCSPAWTDGVFLTASPSPPLRKSSPPNPRPPPALINPVRLPPCYRTFPTSPVP